MSLPGSVINILPTESGTGKVRNGTEELVAGQDLDADAEILELFNFVKTDGTVQRLVYGYEYTADGSPNENVGSQQSGEYRRWRYNELSG